MTMKTQSVTSTDVTLAARDWPNPGAPTVILVHGYPDSQVVWEPVADRLAEQHGLRVITYDVRGAGHSTAPPEGTRRPSRRAGNTRVLLTTIRSPARRSSGSAEIEV